MVTGGPRPYTVGLTSRTPIDVPTPSARRPRDLPAVPATINLTAALALAALVDLALHRVAGRLFFPSSMQGTLLGRALHGLGVFSSHLVGILGVLLFALAFLGVMRRRELFVRGMRLSAGAFGLILAALLVLGLALPQVPSRLVLHLKSTFAFFSWVVAFAASRAPSPWRTKLGVTLFAFPGILHAAAMFAAYVGWGRPELLPADLARAGELCALAAAAACPLLLPAPRASGRRRAVALLVGGAAAIAVGVALVTRFDLVQTVALYGLRLELPGPGAPGAGLYFALVVLATFGVLTYLLLALAPVPPGARAGGAEPSRLCGYGVLLLVCAGYQIGGPSELAAAACGLLALALGTVRASDAAASSRRAAGAAPIG